ncbi:response regulator [Pseudomonas entomophila]|uniref:PAS domain-containing sensor histidine kinase n=1 Tax=Pseudomonas entomophila TaxID=312306 RepID=UPI0023D8AB0E|nr:PAS domain-containing sensor histidine kinase [Pseudomonas entomophila]MDF0729588.1 response regulator [Pseudomonas entomophila]
MVPNDPFDNEDLLLRNAQLEQRMGKAQADRKLFGDLLDSSLANVFVMDRDLTLRAVNRTARDTFQRVHGFVPQVGETLEQCLRDLPKMCNELLPLWRRALAGEALVKNSRTDTAPGTRHYELRFNSLRDGEGQIVGAYLFAYDITERMLEHERLREVELALRQSQKMEAVGQLTGGIAHDFNNLLGGILGALELAQSRLRSSRLSDAGDLLEVAHQNASRAASLVQRLLAFSRRQTLLPQPVDIHLLVEGMRGLLQSSIDPHIEVRDQTRPGLWLTCIDPPQLETALLNLCLNARDAMHAGGVLCIDCENLALDEAMANELQLPAGQYLHLCVMDNGLGMEQDVARRAIDPFFTTKPLGQGTGLGLSMVYGFVRQSGGQLHIVSQPGNGTQVHIYLPRYLDKPRVPPLEPPSIAPQSKVRRQCRVMLVEDQPTMRMVVHEVLGEMGHEVHAFENGPSALAALDSGLHPDLLVSDIGLPGGVDGRQLAEGFRVRLPALPVLFITGFDENAAVAEGQLPTRTEVLLKPFELSALSERVDSLLEAQD